jgi:hypothetical protein
VFSFEAISSTVLIETQIQMSSEEIDARIKAVIKMTAEEDAAAKKKERRGRTSNGSARRRGKKKMEAAAHT